MTRGGRDGVAAALGVGGFGVLTVPSALLMPPGRPVDLVLFSLYSLAALVVAVELAEVLLALLWRPARVPALSEVPSRRRTAVVMTVCDDWDPFFLARLAPLADAGYAAFVLDDSLSPALLPAPLAGRVTVLRRGGRSGAKAGNLDHWLARHGHGFDHLIVLDADSTVNVDAADALLRAAEHPANARVAVFQAKVAPEAARPGTLFSRLLGASLRPRARVLERVHAHLDIVLSAGHNQLVRIEALRRVGGFDRGVSCEDTALTLALAAAGHRTVMVDAWTHDTEPEGIRAYVRRTRRWAAQTVELFRSPWHAAPLRLKLLLCRHLLSFLFPVAAVLMLGLSLWTAPDVAWHAPTLGAVLSLAPGLEWYGLALWPVLACVPLLVALRTVLALLERVPARLVLQSLLLGNATFVAVVLPLFASLVATACGRPVRFVPTNAPVRRVGTGVLATVAGTAALVALLVAGAVQRGGGAETVWIAFIVQSPVSLTLIHLLDRRWVASRVGNGGDGDEA